MNQIVGGTFWYVDRNALDAVAAGSDAAFTNAFSPVGAIKATSVVVAGISTQVAAKKTIAVTVVSTTIVSGTASDSRLTGGVGGLQAASVTAGGYSSMIGYVSIDGSLTTENISPSGLSSTAGITSAYGVLSAKVKLTQVQQATITASTFIADAELT